MTPGSPAALITFFQLRVRVINSATVVVADIFADIFAVNALSSPEVGENAIAKAHRRRSLLGILRN